MGKVWINGVERDETPQESADRIQWQPSSPLISSVSARQFKLQLLAAGLLDAVDAWVAQQPRAIQIAYEYSGTFVKDSPMMTQGFAAMGFSSQQIDAFFNAAAEL